MLLILHTFSFYWYIFEPNMNSYFWLSHQDSLCRCIDKHYSSKKSFVGDTFLFEKIWGISCFKRLSKFLCSWINKITTMIFHFLLNRGECAWLILIFASKQPCYYFSFKDFTFTPFPSLKLLFWLILYFFRFRNNDL